MRWVAAGLLAALAACGSAPEATRSAPLVLSTCPIPEGFEAGLNQIVALTNAFRAKQALSALEQNALLVQAAQGHACDMAATGRFSHTGSGGTTVSDRMEAEGYGWIFAAENIAYRFPFAEGVFESWKSSTGHRENMLNALASQIGLGVAASPDGTLYWVMVLGSPR
jgi:uncharacterized protein YkwD